MSERRLTDADLATIRARREAATPRCLSRPGAVIECWAHPLPHQILDSAADVPALLDEVDALRADHARTLALVAEARTRHPAAAVALDWLAARLREPASPPEVTGPLACWVCGGRYMPLQKDTPPLSSKCAVCGQEGPFWADVVRGTNPAAD